jgi:flagellar basal body-associated protein FliL
MSDSGFAIFIAILALPVLIIVGVCYLLVKGGQKAAKYASDNPEVVTAVVKAAPLVFL